MRSIVLSSLVAFGLIVGGCAGDAEDGYTVVKPYNDSSLAAAESCFDKNCRAYNACLSAAINVSID